MKKAKLVLIAIAFAAGIGGAFAMRPADVCEGFQQYYWTGTSYQPVQGDYGVGWYCDYAPSSTCTYYRPNPGLPNYYVACMHGSYKTVF
jgi:hypothetical protein